MKKLILLLLLTGLTATVAWAQNEVTVKQIEEIIQDADGNSVNVSRDDLFNKFSAISAISNLQQPGTEASHVAHINVRGNYNTTNITQFGSGNIGAINIDGYNRNTVDLNQRGTNLLSLITVEGSSNELSMDQSGQDLGNLVQVQGSNMNIGLTQDNEKGFRYYQNGPTSNSIGITSTSSYVPIIIRNN